jgi:hypothetical protein
MLFPPFEIAKRIVDRKDHATVLSPLAKKLRFDAMVPAYAPAARKPGTNTRPTALT